MENKQIIGLFVHNHPGVLLRVTSLISRRGFNIDSLTVSPAAVEGYSRMTIRLQGSDDDVEQFINQIMKIGCKRAYAYKGQNRRQRYKRYSGSNLQISRFPSKSRRKFHDLPRKRQPGRYRYSRFRAFPLRHYGNGTHRYCRTGIRRQVP